MRAPLRIAILECDELAGEMAEAYGSISNLLTALLEAGALKLEESGLCERPQFSFSSYDVVNKQEYPDVKDIDAVFLSGSRYDSFTPGLNNWITKLVDFTKEMLQDQSQVRVMALCFGHQIVGRAYGVMPERNNAGWEVSVTPVTLTETGKQVFGQSSLYPASVEMLGHSDRCHVQGIYVRNRVMSLQGHPEYNKKIANEFLDRRRGSALDEATYQDGKNRADDQHDGVTVGAGFVKFLLEN